MILFLYAIIILGILGGLLWLRQKINEWTIKKDFEKIFKKSQVKLPTLKIGTSYSWATFDITFSTKEDLEFAETTGLIRQFKNEIRSRYSKDFDVDRAIYCKYVGQIPVWQSMFKGEKNIGTDEINKG
jgi:hypothetical protein